MSGAVRIRPIRAADWPAISALESGAYASLGLSEERAALESRARASPGTCFALDVGPRLAGYLLALPYPASRYPDLARPEQDVPRRPGSGGAAGGSDGGGGGAGRDAAGNLHLHDLVIAEPLRRRGLARHLLHHLLATAAAGGHRRVSLVAVAGSGAFWSANGFTACPEVAVPPESYGPDAVYMSRPLHGTD